MLAHPRGDHRFALEVHDALRSVITDAAIRMPEVIAAPWPGPELKVRAFAIGQRAGESPSPAIGAYRVRSAGGQVEQRCFVRCPQIARVDLRALEAAPKALSLHHADDE